MGLFEFVAFQPSVPQVFRNCSILDQQGAAQQPVSGRRNVRLTPTASLKIRTRTRALRQEAGLSTRRNMPAGARSQLGAPFIDRHIAVVDPLLIHPFPAEALLSG